MIEDLTFLEEGEYTKRDEPVKTIAQEIKREKIPEGISKRVSDLKYDGSDKDRLFRRRTASEILESGFTTGYTDVALAFIALAREIGIPTRYVETVSEEWLQNSDLKRIEGHIFVDMLINGNWRAYEPKRGFRRDNRYALNGREYFEIGKGLDFSGIYVRENGVYRPEPIKIQTLGDIREISRHLAAINREHVFV